MRKLKILQILNCKSITGGMELYAFNLARSLKERGHEAVMAVRPGSDVEKAAIASGVETIPITRGGALQPYNIYSIARGLVNKKFDIMHAHTGNDYWPPLIARWLTLHFGSRVFVTRHVLSPPRGFSSYFYFQHVDTICVSRAVFARMREIASKRSRMHMVYPGIDVEKFSRADIYAEWRERFNIGADEFVIGTMHKWFSKNVKIMEKILEAAPGVKIIVAGSLKDFEIKRLESLKDARRVFRTGNIKNMPEFYKSINLFLFPSFDEAFGMVVPEALTMGVPCVVADSGGTSEIFEDGSCGFKISADRPELYAETISKIINDGELYKRLSENTVRTGLKYSLAAMADAIEDIYYKSLGLK